MAFFLNLFFLLDFYPEFVYLTDNIIFLPNVTLLFSYYNIFSISLQPAM